MSIQHNSSRLAISNIEEYNSGIVSALPKTGISYANILVKFC